MLVLSLTDGETLRVGDHRIRAERHPGCWHLVYEGQHAAAHELEGGTIYVRCNEMRGSHVRVQIKAPNHINIKREGKP